MVMSFTYAIALTGSIATGKSSVASLLKKEGFELIDADTIAHQILDEQSLNISKMFGDNLVYDGKVDRKALGKIVFLDKAKREKLEALLHPLIYNEIEKLSLELDKKKKPYFVDIPLFYETNRYPIKKSLVVYTPVDIQLERLMRRDNLSIQEAQNRIDTQIIIDEKVKQASYVIDNSGTLAELKHACKRVQKEIVGDFK